MTLSYESSNGNGTATASRRRNSRLAADSNTPTAIANLVFRKSGRMPPAADDVPVNSISSDNLKVSPSDGSFWSGVDLAAPHADDDQHVNLHGALRTGGDEQPQQRFLIAPRNLIQATGGGLAALLLSRLAYWTSAARDGQPRCRPQPLVMPEGIESSTIWITTTGLLCGSVGLDPTLRKHSKRLQRAVDRLLHAGLVACHRNIADPWGGALDLAHPGALVGEVMRCRPVDRWILAPTRPAIELFHSRDKVFRRVYLHWIGLMPANAALVLATLWSMTFRHGHAASANKITPVVATHQGLATLTGLTRKQVRLAMPHLLQQKFIIQTTKARGQILPAWQILETSVTHRDLPEATDQLAGMGTPEPGMGTPEAAMGMPEAGMGTKMIVGSSGVKIGSAAAARRPHF